MNIEKRTIPQITEDKQITTRKSLYHTMVPRMTIYPGPLISSPHPSTHVSAATPVVCGAGDSDVDVAVAVEARASSSQDAVATPSCHTRKNCNVLLESTSLSAVVAKPWSLPGRQRRK